MNSIAMKTCRNGDQCINPLGHTLPATEEYFRRSKGALLNDCRICEREKSRLRAKQRYATDAEYREYCKDFGKRKRHGENYDKVMSERAFASEMEAKGYKRCSKGEKCLHPNGCWLPATTEYFRGATRMRLGLRSDCIACQNQMWQETRERHREKINERAREYHARNREAQNEASRRYKQQHWTEILEYSRNYYAAHRDEINEKQREKRQKPEVKLKSQRYAQRSDVKERAKQYRLSEKGRLVANTVTRRRRARKRSLPDTFTSSDWLYALEYFNHSCAVCGRQLRDLLGEHTAAADHWIPLASSDCPGSVVTNLLPLCHGVNGCNNRKQARDPVEFLETEFGARRAREILARIESYFAHLRERTP